MIYLCGQQRRRELVLGIPALNGIDYLEVLGPPGCGTELAITFLRDATTLPLTTDNVMITGGTPVAVTFVTPASAQNPNLVIVTLDSTGDFAPYTLTLVASAVPGDGFTDPPAGIDPALSTVDFSFKAGCSSPADCDCADSCGCALCQPQPPMPLPPDINYLARDYDGFRQVMLDRLAVLAPAWTERHAADLGIVLAEVLAYAADHLSYAQDAVGTEAYLNTARSRISLRRHARLVDYHISEGYNARAVIVLTTSTDGLEVPAGTLFYPTIPGLPAALTDRDPRFSELSGTEPAFTSLADVTVHTEQNEMSFYTWGDDDCCLPAGATEATLQGNPQENLTSLAPGAILVFEEVLGPATGAAADADPAHRCAVRLVNVGQRTDPVTGTPVTRISWAEADALPFPLQVSGGITVARGNAVQAEHGVTVSDEPLPVVSNAGRYYPQLGSSPLSFGVPFDANGPLADFLKPDPKQALPRISLTDGEGNPWQPWPDLLSSTPEDLRFVPEVEHDATVFLRFGDGVHGALPHPNMTFSASYQVGNGTAGNVGADALGHAVIVADGPEAAPFPVWQITGVRNPLAVTGGVDGEPMDHIRQFALFAFQTQARCVTEADYAQQAALIPGVGEARGSLRWTGSWYTAFVSVDPATVDVSEPMQRLRMLGTDVAAAGAIIVGLRIELAVCVDPAHFRGDVYAALLAAFTGADGVLAARRFTFGQTVYASPLINAAQSVAGVSSVTLTTFSRLDQPWVDGVAAGFLTLGRLEIPRCDNDPDHLDHGLFTLAMEGGK